MRGWPAGAAPGVARALPAEDMRGWPAEAKPDQARARSSGSMRGWPPDDAEPDLARDVPAGGMRGWQPGAEPDQARAVSSDGMRGWPVEAQPDLADAGQSGPSDPRRAAAPRTSSSVAAALAPDQAQAAAAREPDQGGGLQTAPYGAQQSTGQPFSQAAATRWQQPGAGNRHAAGAQSPANPQAVAYPDPLPYHSMSPPRAWVRPGSAAPLLGASPASQHQWQTPGGVAGGLGQLDPTVWMPIATWRVMAEASGCRQTPYHKFELTSFLNPLLIKGPWRRRAPSSWALYAPTAAALCRQSPGRHGASPWRLHNTSAVGPCRHAMQLHQACQGADIHSRSCTRFAVLLPAQSDP